MSPELLPYRVEDIGRARVVHFANPQELDLSLGFFRDSVKSAGDKPSRQIMAMPQYLECRPNNYPEGVPAPTVIFHVARCGSTLLCQNLKASGKFIVLGEPGFLGTLINNQSLDRAETGKLVRTLIADWARWAATQNKALVIKLSSAVNYNITQAIDILGPVKRVGLYRDPAPVMESLMRKPPRHIKEEKYPSSLLKTFPLSAEIDALTDIADPEMKTTAGYIAISLHAMLKVLEAGGHMLDYHDLESAFPGLVSFLSDTGDASCHPAAATWNSTWAAKTRKPERVPYVPIADAELRKFKSANPGVLSILKVAYDQLSSQIKHQQHQNGFETGTNRDGSRKST